MKPRTKPLDTPPDGAQPKLTAPTSRSARKLDLMVIKIDADLYSTGFETLRLAGMPYAIGRYPSPSPAVSTPDDNLQLSRGGGHSP